MANENGGDVSERKEELLHSIEEDEEELLEAMHELAEATEQKLDIAQYIRSRPFAWVAGAFCVGLWLGMRRDKESVYLPIPMPSRRTG
ncbi:MAG TPA: hypothetical protein VN634_12865 [Candidatus Limnocylindrales bacterium]|jgi:hypothetical protein|nr:hypothetical protein [Candidatus Limnocylindrales bacterium]